MKVRIEEVDPRTLELLEVNARFMRHETFSRLTKNVEADGALTSVPFCVRSQTPGFVWEVLSGNHRVKAAIAAGVATILIMVTDEELAPARKRAIQLAHNALVGEDDPAVLKQVYEAIDDVDLKRYTGLDDKTLQLIERIKAEPTPSIGLEWTTVQFLFLPDELDRMKRVFETLGKAAAKVSATGRWRDYDRFMEAVSLAGGAHGVANTATSLLILLDVFERHVDDLAEGFVPAAGEAPRKGRVPAAAALGALQVPASTAAAIAKLVESVPKAKRFQAIEAACNAWRESAAGASGTD